MRLSASWTGTPPAGCVGARCRRFVPCVLLFLGAVAGVAEAQPTPTDGAGARAEREPGIPGDGVFSPGEPGRRPA